MKVLVVDDAAANRMVLAALLKRFGHEALTAGGVEEALAVVRETRPEAVLTDLHMPAGCEGLALARNVRSLSEGCEMRMALMTGDAESYDDSEGLFDAILEKPVLKEDLINFLGGMK